MSQSTCSFCTAACFVVTLLFAQQSATAFCEPKQEKQNDHTDSIQNVLKVEDKFDLYNSVAKLVEKASGKQLQEYKMHPHNTIALHAAWEEVKRATTISRGKLLKLKNKEDANKKADTDVPLNRVALRELMGFLEGRLRVAPPKWWRKKMLEAKIDWDAPSSLWFPPWKWSEVLDGRDTPYWEIKGELPSLITLEMTPLADGRLKVTSGKLSCTIPARYLEEAKKEYGPMSGNFGPKRWMQDAGFTAWLNEDRCVFAFHGGLSSKFKLHCIDRKTSAHIWSTEVWGYFWGGWSGEAFAHWMEIRCRDDALYLFGMDGSGIAYIEGHSMKDGRNLLHFCPNYFSHE